MRIIFNIKHLGEGISSYFFIEVCVILEGNLRKKRKIKNKVKVIKYPYKYHNVKITKTNNRNHNNNKKYINPKIINHNPIINLTLIKNKQK